MIYLLGISHKFQHDKNLPKSQEFKKYLDDKIKFLKIDFLAEEFSESSLKTNKIKKTIPQEIAKKLKIKHKFCDPNFEERKNIGYPSDNEIKVKLGFTGPILAGSSQDNAIAKEQRKYYHIRETYWLQQLKSHKNNNILFLCGRDHIDNSGSLKLLLNKFEFNYKILPERFTDWQK